MQHVKGRDNHIEEGSAQRGRRNHRAAEAHFAWTRYAMRSLSASRL